MDFYTIVSIVAILLLIISLTTVGVIMTQSNSNATFPSFQNPCPDYWTYNSVSDTCSMNGNTNMGSFRTTPTPVSSASSKNLCQSLSWSKTNNILWDGVSNTNISCPK
jgi:hypothetical protein